MSFQSLDFLLRQAEETQNKNVSKKTGKIDFQTPFSLNDLMFDDNELCSSEENLTSSMSQLHIENKITEECSNINDYINKHLSLYQIDEPKFSPVENIKTTESKLSLSDQTVYNINNENEIMSKKSRSYKSNYVNKNKIFNTKPYSKMQKSSLKKPSTGFSLVMGRKYPKSSSNALNHYLYNVLIETRSRGFKFNTPSPDESVLSWMDIVRQMPSK